jgi:prolipoprotein diacylglyceryl transferase
LIIGAIPSPASPLIIQIGPFSLHWYGVLIALGILAAVWLSRRELARRGLNPDAVYTIAAWCVPAGVIGARLYHVVTDYELFRGHLVRIPEIWTGGLGLPGVLAGGALGAYVGARRAGLAPLVVFDCLAPGLIAAQAIGRWGNYANQELFGRPSTLPWAVRIDPSHRPARFLQDATFQPTFLYESLWNALILACLLWLIPRVWRRVPAGTIFLTYLAGYAIGRLATESLRSDFAHQVLGLRVNQWVFGIVLIVAAPVVLRRFAAARRHTPYAAELARVEDEPPMTTLGGAEQEARAEQS